jgi:hypothetical protein
MVVWLTVAVSSVGRAALRAPAYLFRALHTAQSRRHARFENRAIRGMTLLREWLSPQQRQQLDCYNYFEVIGCESGKSYRIQHGVCQNVVELDGDGRPRMGWCFIPQGNLVPGDVMLAQKIALETDEEGALTIAKQFLVPPLPPFIAAMT